MAARWYYESEPDVWTEITDRISREDWEVREQAEEGSAAMSTLVIDDPDMDFDIVGRIIIYCVEDTSEADDDRLFGGIVADQEIGRAGGEWLQPLGRIWTVSVTDLNANWQRRVMVGTDCNRPAETDVERVQWLMTGTETNWATDRTTYISTATPVDMDACDYRGQMCAQVMDDCAQASGKNWYTWLLKDGGGDAQIAVWYGRDSLAVYDSPLFLSNDPDDWLDAELADGTSLVWPISMDTKLRRDPSRVYSGVYLTYSGGAVYRLDQDTIDEFSPWDFVAPSYNVKSKTKAIARALRYLDELDVQDEVITTSVELPAAKATMLRAGMRVPFRATHLPGYNTADTFYWCRVLSCSITPIAAGERYRLTLELAPTGATNSGPVVYRPLETQELLYPDQNLGDSGDETQRLDWMDYDNPLDAAFDYHVESGYYTGFEFIGDVGLLDIEVHVTDAWAHTGHGGITTSIDLLKNGSVIATDSVVYPATGSFGFESGEYFLTTNDVAAVTGDIFTIQHRQDPGPNGVTVPSGTGVGEYFRILSTSQVSP
jgi:hypothetical protein